MEVGPVVMQMLFLELVVRSPQSNTLPLAHQDQRNGSSNVNATESRSMEDNGVSSTGLQILKVTIINPVACLGAVVHRIAF